MKITLNNEEREQLMRMSNSRSMPHGLVRRANIILMAAEDIATSTIAEKLGISRPTVYLWRKRFIKQRMVGLYDELRPGRPRSISDEEVAELIKKTLRTKPKGGTQWSCRSIADETDISKSTVHRVWQAFGLQPHRQKHFKLSTDPFFVKTVIRFHGQQLLIQYSERSGDFVKVFPGRKPRASCK